MSKILLTLPGKVGDNLSKIPIAYQYAKQFDTKVDIALDLNSGGIKELLDLEDWVDDCFLSHGIHHYGQGGCPIDFGRHQEWSDQYDQIFHLGYRNFPANNLTIHSFHECGVPIDPTNLLTEPCFKYRHNSNTNLLFQAESSRSYADDNSRLALLSVLPEIRSKFDSFYISVYQHPIHLYNDFLPYNPTFITDTRFSNILELAENSFTVTTYAAIACLMHAAKFPVLTILDGDGGSAGLTHFVQGISYYGKDLTARCNDYERIREILNNV